MIGMYAKEKKKKTLCARCGKQGAGWRLEWHVSWFRGDDEFENICDDCEEKRLLEEKIENEKAYKRAQIQAKRDEKFWKGMKGRLEEKYEVKYLTQYQWRINGVIDLFITNRRYHDIKNNKRGGYQDMHSFLEKFFKSLPNKEVGE